MIPIAQARPGASANTQVSPRIVALCKLSPDRACRVSKAIAATILSVDLADIGSPRRETARIARARHVAMYLAHTTLSLTLAETGAIFGRDRTSVAYAMRRIEDARDSAEFDALLSGMELLARTFREASAPTGKEGTFDDA